MPLLYVRHVSLLVRRQKSSAASQLLLSGEARVWISATGLTDSRSAAGSRKGIELFLDQVAMNDAERWMEIAETMTFEVAAIEVAEIAADGTVEVEAETTEQIEANETTNLEMIEPAPRARVLSITQLRQKLGIEEVAAPVARARAQEPVTGTPPRIVSRRREMAMQQLMAG
jgi:hypothetical protein